MRLTNQGSSTVVEPMFFKETTRPVRKFYAEASTTGTYVERNPAAGSQSGLVIQFPPQPEAHTPAPWLDRAMADLDAIDQESREENYEPASARAKKNARRILKVFADHDFPNPAVYPTEDGEIHIFLRDKDKAAAVLVECDSDGRGACFSTFAGTNRRARYDDARELPDEFVLAQLRRLTDNDNDAGARSSAAV